jgi:hypothetical protein
VDPSSLKFQKYYNQGIHLIVEFFSCAAFRERFPGRKAKIVTSIAMFYDLEDPQTFVNDVAEILTDDGVWHLEQSYLPLMLRTNSYDTVCHEHIEYYSLRQLDWMTKRAGLRIIDAQLNGTNGGSFAVTVAKIGSGFVENRAAIDALIKDEIASGIDTMHPWAEFCRHVVAHRAELRNLFDRIRRQKKKVLGYGASTKGNTLLQYCGITGDLLPCIAEINEDKFGCYTPGTWIPIVPEQQARDMCPDYFLVLPWHFRDSIVKREALFVKRGSKLIFPLPNIEIVS